MSIYGDEPFEPATSSARDGIKPSLQSTIAYARSSESFAQASPPTPISGNERRPANNREFTKSPVMQNANFSRDGGAKPPNEHRGAAGPPYIVRIALVGL